MVWVANTICICILEWTKIMNKYQRILNKTRTTEKKEEKGREYC